MLRRWSHLVPDSLRGLIRKRRFQSRNARFEPYPVRKSIDGTRFEFLIGDPIGEDWYVPLNSASPEMRFLRDRMVRPGDVILECGAHHGFLTILMAEWIGEHGRVVAFEPSASSAAILRANVARNGLESRVRVEEKAVSSKAGILHVSVESNAVPLRGPQLAADRVRSTTLDEYADLGPTVVKLDVEGFELEVLRGASRILERAPKWAIEVHVEMMRRYGYRADELLEHVRPDAYDLWVQLGGAASPRPYAGERLEDQHMDQVHLYALPKGRV